MLLSILIRLNFYHKHLNTNSPTFKEHCLLSNTSETLSSSLESKLSIKTLRESFHKCGFSLASDTMAEMKTIKMSNNFKCFTASTEFNQTVFSIMYS